MNNYQEFPLLKILPTEKLFPHEQHDEQRTPPLITKLNKSGRLKNPPLVSPFLDQTDHYMVLDGANRITAFKEMGFPHILAQVVEPGSENLSLSTWSHIVCGIPAEEMLGSLKEIPELTIIDQASSTPEDIKSVCALQFPDGRTIYISCLKYKRKKRLKIMNKVMDCYKHKAKFDRTAIHDVQVHVEFYKDLSFLLSYQTFKIEDIFKLSGKGRLFPSGITRFQVAPRALRVNYPLSELASSDSLEEKNKRFHEWMEEVITKRKVRFYEEPTMLFDE